MSANLVADMELSEDEIQKIILEILTGERVVRHSYIRDGQHQEEILVFKYPIATVRQYYHILEKVSFEKAVHEGLLVEDQIPEELIEAFFSTEDMEELYDLETKAEALQLLLKKRIKGTDLYMKDCNKLEEVKKSIKIMESKKSISNQFTAEYQAKEDIYFELLAASAFSVEGEKMWKSASDLLDNTDASYSYSLLHRFLDFYWGQDTATLRKVARSGQWKSMYQSSEKGARLTEKPAKDLPLTYLRLMSWSQYYQNISEIPIGDRPSTLVVADDEKLDKYINKYQEKMEAESLAVSRKNSSNKGSLSVSDKDQVVVTPGSSNYVALHKSGEYSDTEIITGRVKEDGPSDTSYSEIKERRVKVQERASKRRARSKKQMRGRT